MKKKRIITLAKNFQVMEFPLYIDWSNKHNSCVYHSHNCTELVVVRSGSAHHLTKSSEAIVKKGDIFVIPEGESHCYQDVNEFYIVNILFKLSRLPIPILDAWRLPGFDPLFANPADSFQNNGASAILNLAGDEYDQIMELLKTLTGEQTGGSRFLITSLFMLLIHKLSKSYLRIMPKKKQENSINIERVIEYMHKHLPHKINAITMAKIGRMSSSSLNRHFKKATGMSPVNYLIGLRINKAAQLLTNSELSIAEIACETGFDDSNYFCKVFTKAVGIPPTRYRKNIEHQTFNTE